MKMNKIQKLTVKALFKNGNEVLILKSNRDEFWELPGGKVEFGEHPEQTLKREVDEELRIKNFAIERIIHLWNFAAEDEDGQWDFDVAVYLCRSDDLDKIKLSHEHTEFKWVKISDIKNYPMRYGYYEAITKI